MIWKKSEIPCCCAGSDILRERSYQTDGSNWFWTFMSATLVASGFWTQLKTPVCNGYYSPLVSSFCFYPFPKGPGPNFGGGLNVFYSTLLTSSLKAIIGFTFFPLSLLGIFLILHLVILPNSGKVFKGNVILTYWLGQTMLETLNLKWYSISGIPILL